MQKNGVCQICALCALQRKASPVKSRKEAGTIKNAKGSSIHFSCENQPSLGLEPCPKKASIEPSKTKSSTQRWAAGAVAATDTAGASSRQAEAGRQGRQATRKRAGHPADGQKLETSHQEACKTSSRQTEAGRRAGRQATRRPASIQQTGGIWETSWETSHEKACKASSRQGCVLERSIKTLIQQAV